MSYSTSDIRHLYETACSLNGLNLQYVAVAQRDYELCLTAVKQNGLALEHVPTSFQTELLILEAVKKTPFALKYAYLQTPDILWQYLKAPYDSQTHCLEHVNLNIIRWKTACLEFYLKRMQEHQDFLMSIDEAIADPGGIY